MSITMKTLVEYLLQFKAFRDALIAAGWKAPAGPVVSGGGPGPFRPN